RRAAPVGRRSAAAVTPGVAVADLLGGAALLQLTQRMADRGERHLDASLLQRSADVGRRDRARRGRPQDLADHLRIGATLWAAAACPSAGGATGGARGCASASGGTSASGDTPRRPCADRRTGC